MALVHHEIDPVFDENSRLLILGSIPSPKSRETGFYYGHPQNRFWPLLSTLLKETLPKTKEEKIQLLRKHGIALWDVLASCSINGADDSSIAEAVPNDLPWLFAQCPIKAVFTTGKKATALYQTHCFPLTGMSSIYLPSTSPANQGRFPMERLQEEWGILLSYLFR